MRAVFVGILIAMLLAVAPVEAQANIAPVANAGSDKQVAAGTLQMLSDGGSFDLDAPAGAANNRITAFQWEVVTPAYSWIAIAGAQTAAASFTVPAQELAARYGSTIEFRLTVTDADGATASDTVTYHISTPPPRPALVRRTLTAFPAVVPRAGRYAITLTPAGFVSASTNLAVCPTGNLSSLPQSLVSLCGIGSPRTASGAFTVNAWVGDDGVTFVLYGFPNGPEFAMASVNVQTPAPTPPAQPTPAPTPETNSTVEQLTAQIEAQASHISQQATLIAELRTQLADAQAAANQDGRKDALIESQARLIESQESLLNDYRCLGGWDIHLVPGGCS